MEKKNENKKKNNEKTIQRKHTDVKKVVAVKKKKKVVAKKKLVLVFAHEKYLRTSAQKARLIIALVKNQNALSASERLRFVHKKAALFVRKAVESAIANAVNNFELDKKKLYIEKAFVDDAPIFKRGRAGSRGRYKKILKRNCHITIGVAERKS
jgi:large subunit ribosomal protein L22